MKTLIGKVTYVTEDGYYLFDGDEYYKLVFTVESQADKVPLQTKIAISVIPNDLGEFVVSLQRPFFQEVD